MFDINVTTFTNHDIFYSFVWIREKKGNHGRQEVCTYMKNVATLAFLLPLYEVLQNMLQKANIDTRLIIASTSIRLHCISVENWIIRDVYSSFVPTTLPLRIYAIISKPT